MIINDARLVIVTYDTNFYLAINTALSDLSCVGSITTVTNASLIEGKFIKNKPNILIIDENIGVVSQFYIKQMLEKFNLLLIVAGTQTSSVGSQFVKICPQNFIAKPSIGNAVQEKTFIISATRKIMQFAETASKMTFLDMNRTVTENSKIIAIASSTGGTEALEKILTNLPPDLPPILVVQHMPSGFTKFFADRLNNVCKMEVKEAANGMPIQNGCVYIAPADFHMEIAKSNSKLSLQCFEGTRVNGLMPCADILFDSIAPVMKSNAIGVILTGMGSDGAKGLYKMHLSGARTIGQNKETCVVYGMPKVAYDLGAIDMQLPLDGIAGAIMQLAKN